MSHQLGIPRAAQESLTQMVDVDAQIKPGMEVVVLAHVDGLYGSDNYVDETAIGWIQTMVESRGAHCSVLWIDEVMKTHEWRLPPVVKGAITEADVFINTSLDLAIEEVAEFRQYIEKVNTWYVRLFPVTSTLLCTDWARTPHELVVMIRHVSSDPFMHHLAEFHMTDPNGTDLAGKTLDPVQRAGIPGMPYNSWRRDASHYLPWPEWVHPPINCQDVNGVLSFDCMLPWWSRYIGIAPSWDEPVRIDVENSRMVKISGGKEADALVRYLRDMEGKVGDGMWKFDTFHFGIHPNAVVNDDQCPNAIYRRIIDHSHSSNVHWHVGSAPANEGYNYYPHITADIRHATLTVNDTLVYDNGYLECLQDPRVLEVAAKYPDLPGVPDKVVALAEHVLA
ncbi:MAG TPA: hypothetical protein VMH50_08225 [Thermoleophilia bacterium]|nr:hypothetical protein [Thermoleophilia bacterium]